nr:hypothetical protein [Tanacetum cinerariifolium]
MTIDQQVALDEALVPHASRLRIGKSNFHLRSDITSKESTLQMVYDVQRLTPFYKAFLELYHKKNVEFAYLLWEDFVYQVEHKDANKSNDMYYPSFTKVIIHYFMTKDPSIPKRNKLGAMLPIELTNEDIRNSKAYKEYYAVASGAAPPKTKESVRKMKSSFDTTITPPTTADDEDDVDEGSDDQDDDNDNQDDDDQDKVDDDDDQDEDNDDDQDTDKEGKEFIHPKLSIHDEEETKEEESFDPIVKTPENSDDEGNNDENLGLNVGSEEGQDTEDDEDELYRDVNINLEGRVLQMAGVHTTQEFEDTHVTLTPAPTTVASLTLPAPTLTPSTIPTISTVPEVPIPPTTAPSNLLQDLLNFGSLFGFDHQLKTLELTSLSSCKLISLLEPYILFSGSFKDT